MSATSRELPAPWRAFLADVDRGLTNPVEIHCLGGFVAAFYYDLPRPTNDLDYIAVVPYSGASGYSRSTLTTWPSPSSSGTVPSIARTWLSWPEPFRLTRRSFARAMSES